VIYEVVMLYYFMSVYSSFLLYWFGFSVWFV